MKPYYEHAGITIYHGDCREVLSSLSAESVITDPVWPNATDLLKGSADPYGLFAEAAALFPRAARRAVIHLGCNSDPRFLCGMPKQMAFFRVCSLEYSQCSYVGRLLYTGDIAYVFGDPPAAKQGAMVLPGRCVSTHDDQPKRKTGRYKNHTLQRSHYEALEHPARRHLNHLRWLVKWFAGASVIDPFGGTGTTAVACKLLNIPCQLIEIEEKYCEIAAKRLSQEVLQF